VCAMPRPRSWFLVPRSLFPMQSRNHERTNDERCLPFAGYRLILQVFNHLPQRIPIRAHHKQRLQRLRIILNLPIDAFRKQSGVVEELQPLTSPCQRLPIAGSTSDDDQRTEYPLQISHKRGSAQASELPREAEQPHTRNHFPRFIFAGSGLGQLGLGHSAEVELRRTGSLVAHCVRYDLTDGKFLD
jgi:hypothetical protein